MSALISLSIKLSRVVLGMSSKFDISNTADARLLSLCVLVLKIIKV